MKSAKTLAAEQEAMRLRQLCRPVDGRKTGVRRAYCDECGNDVAVKVNGTFRAHVDDFTGQLCDASGAHVNVKQARKEQVEKWTVGRTWFEESLNARR